MNPNVKLLATLLVNRQGKLDTRRLGLLNYDLQQAIDQLKKQDVEAQLREPLKVERGFFPKEDCWLFRNRVCLVQDPRRFSEEEVSLLVKRHVLDTEGKFNKIRQESEAFENFERIPSARRELIPKSVRLFVWQRDGGKCVECGGRKNLEYDHIIPVVEGGSNTERNIQLLCEQCNRQKGKSVC